MCPNCCSSTKTTKEQLTLVKEKVAISPESVANFIYSWGTPREFPVRKEQEFSLPPHEEIKYKLVDVQPDKAVIVNTRNLKKESGSVCSRNDLPPASRK